VACGDVSTRCVRLMATSGWSPTRKLLRASRIAVRRRRALFGNIGRQPAGRWDRTTSRPPSATLAKRYDSHGLDTPLRHISDTALWVAVYRAEESERTDAVFRDPYASKLAGERGTQIAGDSAESDRRFRRDDGQYSGVIPVSRRSEATLVL